MINLPTFDRGDGGAGSAYLRRRFGQDKIYLTLRAPLKGFYTFENSAHCPIFEEPRKALQILREDVLQGTNRRRRRLDPDQGR